MIKDLKMGRWSGLPRAPNVITRVLKGMKGGSESEERHHGSRGQSDVTVGRGHRPGHVGSV